MFARVNGPEFLWIEEYTPTGFNTNSCAISIRIFYVWEINFNVFGAAKQAVYSFSDLISVLSGKFSGHGKPPASTAGGPRQGLRASDSASLANTNYCTALAKTAP